MTDLDPVPRRGYLLPADISGYTAFLETNVPELWGDALKKVLEEDGVVPGSGDNADARAR